MASEIKVFAPATISNLACGFDIIGLALNHPGDEIIARLTKTKGLKIIKITGTATKQLPFEIEKNTAGLAAKRVLENIGEEGRGIELEIHKKMPFGSGLGSSAASAVAGAFAVNELLGAPLSKKELLPFAVEGEMLASGSLHADNVAPSLLGGIVLIRDNNTLDLNSVPYPEELHITVIYPEVEILTKEARAILKKEVSLQQLIKQTGNLGSLILGFTNADFELIKRSLEDVVIEPQRSKLIPFYQEAKEAALEAGALGCNISGAGPSIFALSTSNLEAENIGVSMKTIFSNQNIPTQLFISPVNPEGAIRY